MAIPTPQAKTAFLSSAASVNIDFTGLVASNDILLICAESSDSTTAAGTPTVPSGFTLLFEETQGGGALGVTTLSVFGKVSAGTETTVATGGVANHINAIGLVVRGADPVIGNVQVGAGNGANTGNGTVTGLTTGEANNLIVAVVATTRDAGSTAQFSAWTNGGLASPAATEWHDQTNTTGAGGGLGIAYGGKAAAGATGNTTVTIATSEQWRAVHLAIQEAAGGGTTYEKTGSLTADTTAAGTDVAEHARTGSLTADTTAAGTDVAEHSRAGSLTSRATVAGADVAEHARTGSLLTQPVLSGPSQKISGGGTTYEKAGSLTAGARAAGPDSVERIETGTLTAGTQPRAADVHENVEAGTLTAGTRPAGADVFTATETGALLVDTLLSGIGLLVGPLPDVVPGDVLIVDAHTTDVATTTLTDGAVSVQNATGAAVMVADAPTAAASVGASAAADVTIREGIEGEFSYGGGLYGAGEYGE